MRFDDRVTGNLKTYSPHSQAKSTLTLIHPNWVKMFRLMLVINGDLKTVIGQWSATGLEQQSHPEWLNRIRDWQEDSHERDILHQDSNGKLLTAQVINDLWKYTDGNSLDSQ